MCDWFLWSNQDLQVYQSSAFQVRIGFYVGILLSLSLKTSILWFPGSAAWTLCLSKPSRSTIGWRDSSTVSCAPRTKIITQTKNNQESKNVSNSQNISGNVPYFWTSGRLCDFDGCDRPDFFPKNINGWFWSANQVLWPKLLYNYYYYLFIILVRQPGSSQPDQRFRLPRLVRHRRVQSPEAPAWQQGTDSAGGLLKLKKYPWTYRI